uniref:Uncharacterized protein n=1 Tax=Rhizophora mucronata TaxID=61149 RepID=A0A2P2MX55_RHIMU
MNSHTRVHLHVKIPCLELELMCRGHSQVAPVISRKQPTFPSM